MKNEIEQKYLAAWVASYAARALMATIFAVLLLPLGSAAGVRPSYLPPTDRPEWSTVDPGSSGWNLAALDELVSFTKAHRSTGLLIVQDGKIVSEHYWPVTSLDLLTRPRFYSLLSHGLTKEGQPIEDVASVQKSLVSFLVGKAVGKGLIDIEAPVSRYLGKGWSKAGVAEQTILVRHLLSMDSGLDTRLRYEQPAGTYWRYNTPAYSRLVPVLEAATHREIGSLTKEWVFDPVGMHDSRWVVRSGIWAISNSNTVGFLTTPRDLARLGLLVMMDGKWDGKDIIGNDSWFPLSVSRSQEMNPAYGFLWWLNGTAKPRFGIRSEPPLRDGPLVPTAPRDLIIAMGHEKRRLYISPGYKLVIVRFGSDPGSGFDREFWKYASAALPRKPASSRTSSERHQGVNRNAAATR
jgi:CubicO group peptidase (beta-lactamase class C family)